MSSTNDFSHFIRKKGSIEIITRLRFFPKRYNQIKRETEPLISARTLDHRLDALVTGGYVNVNQFDDTVPVGREYYLTSRGMVVDSINVAFSRIHRHDDVNGDGRGIDAEVADSIITHYKVLESYNWNRVRNDIYRILDTTNVIETLSFSKRDVIERYDRDAITVHTEKGTATVPAGDLRFVWNNLLVHQRLLMTDYEKTTYRSSFICALLARLDYVHVSEKRPVYIYIDKKVDCETFPIPDDLPS